jgi:hypothetical protein
MTAPVSPTATIDPGTSQDEVDGKLEQTQPSDTDSTQVMLPKDFGFIPVPRHLRYDPTKPSHFGLVLNVGFGLVSTFSGCFPPFFDNQFIDFFPTAVANLYYCQPLLSKFVFDAFAR